MKQMQVQSQAKRPFSDAPQPFYRATVLSPATVAQRTENYPEEVRAAVGGHWFLCGDVSKPTFDLLQAELPGELAMRLTALTSPAGAYYGVLSHQTKGHVHRFVLPLYEPSAVQLLKAVVHEPMAFLLGRDEEGVALVLQSALPGSEFAPLAALCRDLSSEQLHEAIGELPSLIGVVKEPAQIPSAIPGTAIDHVDVSVLLPVAAFTSVLSGHGGRLQ